MRYILKNITNDIDEFVLRVKFYANIDEEFEQQKQKFIQKNETHAFASISIWSDVSLSKHA